MAVLGTFGELLAIRLRLGHWYFFGPGPMRMVKKIIIWAFLGITFKYTFAGFFGFVDALIHKNFWMQAAKKGVFRAFSVSLFCNLLFGPVMMLFHRFTDNWIEDKKMDWNGLVMAWKTLFWFWIPAHTLTFSLPAHFQVGMAAFLAVALGVILGASAQKDSRCFSSCNYLA